MAIINYHISVADISAHLIEVELRFTPQQTLHQLTMASWIPGSYMIRDFARNIINISACDADGELLLVQLDKQCWQLSCREREVSVRYQLYANDLSVRAAYLDDLQAVLNPAGICFAVSGQEQLQHQLTIARPEFRVTENWQLATGLTPSPDTAFMAFGTYQADNYQQLVDTPLLAGELSYQTFILDGIPHHLVFTGKNLTDYPRIARDVEILCRHQSERFNGLPEDLTAYWFLVWVTDNGYGGLEHHNSTLLLCSRFDLPEPSGNTVDDNYQNFLALCSHEYFHTWWVKRLKPSVFHHYQLTQEQYTRQLWIYEGFTSYYDDLALVRTGLISTEQYLRTLEKTITRVTRNKSNTIQSLQDSSFNAWTKFYKQDENAVNAVVSYYAKGALLALCLDGALRQQRYSLDWLIQQMWQQYLNTGTDDDSIFLILSNAGFNALAEAVRLWVTEPVMLPLSEMLPVLGIELTFRTAEHQEDLSGPAKTADSISSLGALYKSSAQGIQLTHIHHDGAAHQAGLMAGDQLLAIAGYKITESSLQPLLRRLPAGSVQPVYFFRKDRLLTASLLLQPSALQVAQLAISDISKTADWLQT
ncbi:PDZ domain-containing protein [Chromatiaceae bacterium AAb-1]|nr:PDZ domain-containing protein [Chromatiaceae bacterium AAb-1]